MVMLEKIKIYQNHPIVKSLGNIRTLGMIAFGVISLLVTWSSVRVVQTNYDLQKQLSALQQQNDVRKLANNNMKLKNEFYTTDTYLELAARKHFNKAAPGEKLLIVPKQIALKHSIAVKEPDNSFKSAEAAVEAGGTSFQRNFNAWLDFLFHRQN